MDLEVAIQKIADEYNAHNVPRRPRRGGMGDPRRADRIRAQGLARKGGLRTSSRHNRIVLEADDDAVSSALR